MDGRWDLIVAGAGVLGLWVARAARARGRRVLVVDSRRAGGGASGGVLGALMAHQPDGWTEAKAFQLAALTALPERIAALEAETGHAVGYGRIGRLLPLRTEAALEAADRRAVAAAARWAAADPSFELAPTPPGEREARFPGYLDPAMAPLGWVQDSLAARVDPQRYIAALASALRADPGAALWEGVAVTGWANGAAQMSDGRQAAAEALVVAAGWESFALLGRLGRQGLGAGVKGQAALFEGPAPPGAPLLYDRGAYVAPHANGMIAVGSSTETAWSGAPDAPAPETAAFLAQARALCPLLRDREPVAWWAGVRPRTAARPPLLGRLAGSDPIWVATGGYKITLGIAHAMAEALAATLDGATPLLPAPSEFAPAAHGV